MVNGNKAATPNKEKNMTNLEIGRTYTIQNSDRKYTYAGLKWDHFNQRQYHGFRTDLGDLVPFFSADLAELRAS